MKTKPPVLAPVPRMVCALTSGGIMPGVTGLGDPGGLVFVGTSNQNRIFDWRQEDANQCRGGREWGVE